MSWKADWPYRRSFDMLTTALSPDTLAQLAAARSEPWIEADDQFDDGLDHGHSWAGDSHARDVFPTVADAASVPTPSSAVHDDTHHEELGEE
jgi:hypothetical protein